MSLSRWLTFACFTCPSLLLGDELPPPPPGEPNVMQTVIMVAIGLAFFYLIMWRPEMKRRKELEEQRDLLSKGDEVIAMGIVGTVSQVLEETVILKMVDGNKIKVIKAAISEVHSREEES